MLCQWGMKRLWGMTNGLKLFVFLHNKNSESWMLVAGRAAQKFHPRPRILLFFHSTTCDLCHQLSHGYKMATTPPGIASKFQAGRRGRGRNTKQRLSPDLSRFPLEPYCSELGHVVTPAVTQSLEAKVFWGDTHWSPTPQRICTDDHCHQHWVLLWKC